METIDTTYLAAISVAESSQKGPHTASSFVAIHFSLSTIMKGFAGCCGRIIIYEHSFTFHFQILGFRILLSMSAWQQTYLIKQTSNKHTLTSTIQSVVIWREKLPTWLWNSYAAHQFLVDTYSLTVSIAECLICWDLLKLRCSENATLSIEWTRIL